MPRSRNPARVANRHAVPSSSRSVATAPGVRTASTSAFGNAARMPSAAMAAKPSTSGRVSVVLNSAVRLGGCERGHAAHVEVGRVPAGELAGEHRRLPAL